MLTNAQEKLIRSLHRSKGRAETGLCLVEGAKVIETAGDAIDFTFTAVDTPDFAQLVTTETPQEIAAVARVPNWSEADLADSPTLVVLDGVQDPGNVGSILRLCLGFGATLLLIESADVTSPKVVRSSVGAMFLVPWLKMKPEDAEKYLSASRRQIFRLEKNDRAVSPDVLGGEERIALIAGSEGSGINLPIAGTSVEIPHDQRLESLNVTHAIAIALYARQ
ncbi:MAG: RNA methyltransferase [Patescibacteria group bacterium]